jgi:hypothetical protein
VAQARDKAQEKIDNDFTRRSALITEALNSHAIDIAKALDSDVSDTAWSAYLKGDRGIFSRRFVGRPGDHRGSRAQARERHDQRPGQGQADHDRQGQLHDHRRRR